ncbi:MAG TPA: hypothetical protein VGP72_27495 [Planctomycetota bacterium]|jgi:hypothetical protein
MLFELNQPLDELESLLLHGFAGKTIRVRDIYEQHSVNRPYLLRNYKEVLNQLEAKHAVSIEPPASKRPSRSGRLTLKDEAAVTFPK